MTTPTINYDDIYKTHIMEHMVSDAIDNHIQIDPNTIVFVFNAMEYGTFILVATIVEHDDTITIEYKWKHMGAIAWYNDTIDMEIDDTMTIWIETMVYMVAHNIQW